MFSPSSTIETEIPIAIIRMQVSRSIPGPEHFKKKRCLDIVYKQTASQLLCHAFLRGVRGQPSLRIKGSERGRISANKPLRDLGAEYLSPKKVNLFESH